jgi:formyl-CoA transferase
MDEVFADPQVRHLGMAAPVQHSALGAMRVVNQPLKLSRTPNTIVRATPEKGEHTAEVLAEYGFSDDEIERFRGEGIV